MGGGLTGYDPVFADPLNEFGDPGLRNQIFKQLVLTTYLFTYLMKIVNPLKYNSQQLRYFGG